MLSTYHRPSRGGGGVICLLHDVGGCILEYFSTSNKRCSNAFKCCHRFVWIRCHKVVTIVYYEVRVC